MAYVPFTNDYTGIRTPAYVAAELAGRTAQQSRMNDIFVDGNKVMGNLVASCCSDPAFAGQGFYDDSSGDFGTPGSTASDPMAVLPIPGSSVPGSGVGPPVPGSYPLTPVDILTGSYGFPLRGDGRPWPRPRIPNRFRRQRINAFPNFGSAIEASQLAPPCPCFSSAAPVPITVPTMVTPTQTVAPTAPGPAAPCPYPACSTGNVCLDLVTGCVLNSQITSDQQQACALANYGVFGNKGFFLGDVIKGCQPPPYLGSPNLSPPQADPSMMSLINAAYAKKGVSGLGQVEESSNVGGFLAILAVSGIVVWAMRK